MSALAEIDNTALTICVTAPSLALDVAVWNSIVAVSLSVILTVNEPCGVLLPSRSTIDRPVGVEPSELENASAPSTVASLRISRPTAPEPLD